MYTSQANTHWCILGCHAAVLEKGQQKQNRDGLITADVKGTAEEASLSTYMAEGDRHLPLRPLLRPPVSMSMCVREREKVADRSNLQLCFCMHVCVWAWEREKLRGTREERSLQPWPWFQHNRKSSNLAHLLSWVFSCGQGEASWGVRCGISYTSTCKNTH